MVASELLGGGIVAALHAADITDGLVDPTVGRAVVASGYDADLDTVRTRGPLVTADTAVVPGWRSVAFEPEARTLWLRKGTLLDLGATAKAYAADIITARLALGPGMPAVPFAPLRTRSMLICVAAARHR